MKKLHLILATAFLLVVFNLKAQEKPLDISIKVGANLARSSGGYVQNAKFKAGFNVGVGIDYNFSPDAVFITGLEFTTKGFKNKETKMGYEQMNVTFDCSATFIQIPLFFGYKLPIANKTKILFYGGPYIAYGIGGTFEIATRIDNDKISKQKPKTFDMLNRFDMGVGAGVGLEFGKIYTRLGWDYGLQELGEDQDSNLRLQNGYLNVGYKF